MHIISTNELFITSVPIGDAPFWVREKWVGISIPLCQSRIQPLFFRTQSIFTHSDNFLSCIVAWVTGKLKSKQGYIVNARQAVDLLAVSAPEAAKWWRENIPHLLREGRCFVFDQNCGYARVIQNGLSND